MDQSSNDLPTGESVAQGYVRSILRGPEMVDVRSRKQEIWLRPAQAAWESPLALHKMAQRAGPGWPEHAKSSCVTRSYSMPHFDH